LDPLVNKVKVEKQVKPVLIMEEIMLKLQVFQVLLDGPEFMEQQVHLELPELEEKQEPQVMPEKEELLN